MIKCEIPKCKNDCIKIHKKDGFFHSVFLKNVTLKTCKSHSKAEIDEALNKAGEKIASSMQVVNPFKFK